MPHALFLGSSLATLDRVSNPVVAATLPLQDQKRTYTFWQQFGRARRALFWVQRAPQGDLTSTRHEVTSIQAATGLQPHSTELTEVPRPLPGSPSSSLRVVTRASDLRLDADENKDEPPVQEAGYRGHQNNSLEFVKAHLGHAIVDIGTLFGVSS